MQYPHTYWTRARARALVFLLSKSIFSKNPSPSWLKIYYDDRIKNSYLHFEASLVFLYVLQDHIKRKKKKIISYTEYCFFKSMHPLSWSVSKRNLARRCARRYTRGILARIDSQLAARLLVNSCCSIRMITIWRCCNYVSMGNWEYKCVYLRDRAHT